MRIALMQPYFFPYIGYFQLIAAVDKIILLDDVNYIKGGWINRNKILIGNQTKWLTIPLERASPNKLIIDINRKNDILYNQKLLKTLDHSYKKASFFERIYLLVKEIINSNERNLSAFLYQSIKKINNYLGINTKIMLSSSSYPKNQLKGQARILDICVKEKATQYINLPGGVNLYNPSTFQASGINLSFLQPIFTPYDQGTQNFIPGLSIIDVLMWNSPEQVFLMIQNYELTK